MKKLFFSLAILSMTVPAAATQSRTAPQDLGVVEGIVTAAGTGEPIADAEIRLFGETFNAQALDMFLALLASKGVTVGRPPVPADERYLQSVIDAAAARGVSIVNPEVQDVLAVLRASTDARLTAVSDDAGRFTIPSVPPGRYTARARKEGYFGGSGDPLAAATLRVTGKDTALVTIPMVPGSTISGHVRGASGQPLFNVTVEAFAVSYQSGFPVLRSLVSKTSDDRGEYRLFWLPAGEYYVAAVPRPDPRRSTADPAPREQVARTYYPGTADVTMAAPVVVKGGERRDSVDISFRSVVTARISGRITFVGAPEPPKTGATAEARGAAEQTIAQFMLMARDTNVPELLNAGGGIPVIGSARLDGASGKFEVAGILPGSYDLYARVAEPNPDGGGGLTFGHVRVDVRGEDISGLTITVYRSVPVKGAVFVDGGAPRHDVRVALQAGGSAAKIPVYRGIEARAVIPAADGSFTIPAVTAATYRLAVLGLRPEEYLADVLQGASVFDTGFEVGAEAPNPLQVIVKTGAGGVSGLVRDAAGTPLADATVVLVPAEERRQNRALYQAVTADSSGHFRIASVAPGGYKVFAWRSIPSGAYYSGAFLAKVEDWGHPVVVAEAATEQVEAVVIPD